MRQFFYNLKYGIENIIHWLPLIWKDRDWDWEFLTRIMEYKLRKMSAHFYKYGRHVGNDKDAREMLICAELLKRIAEDDIVNCESFAQHDMRMRGWQKMFGRYFKKVRCWWN